MSRGPVGGVHVAGQSRSLPAVTGAATVEKVKRARTSKGKGRARESLGYNYI